MPMTIRALATAGLATLGMAEPLAAHGAAAAGVDLLSHRAAYRLSLAASDRSTGLTAVKGGLVMEWRAASDGWISNQRLGFVAATEEGPGFSYDVRFSSWESLDNTKLRFNVRTFEGATMHDEFKGQAALDGPGARGEARFVVPPDSTVAIPAGTMYPTEHVRRLIEAASQGAKVASHAVFDGSGLDALTHVTAAIAEARTVPAGPDGAAEQRWPVSLAYYKSAKDDVLPEFEISFELSDRGVLYDVLLNYGDFALKADLEKLEVLPPPACG